MKRANLSFYPEYYYIPFLSDKTAELYLHYLIAFD